MENSTHVERHWKFSTETLWNYTQYAALKLKLIVEFQLFYFFL